MRERDVDRSVFCNYFAINVIIYPTCRMFLSLSIQSVQVSVTLLTQLATSDKLDQSIFRQSCLPVLVQLWSMTDRTVRTVMLQSLKALIPFIPDAVINRTIFDHMMAGFSDSNAKYGRSLTNAHQYNIIIPIHSSFHLLPPDCGSRRS